MVMIGDNYIVWMKSINNCNAFSDIDKLQKKNVIIEINQLAPKHHWKWNCLGITNINKYSFELIEISKFILETMKMIIFLLTTNNMFNLVCFKKNKIRIHILTSDWNVSVLWRLSCWIPTNTYRANWHLFCCWMYAWNEKHKQKICTLLFVFCFLLLLWILLCVNSRISWTKSDSVN